MHFSGPTTKVWPGTMTNLIPPLFLNTLFINHTLINHATKAVKAHVYSATNPMCLHKKPKMAPATLPTKAGNASTAFPASLLSASASLSNHFYKTPSSFDGEPPATPHPRKTPVMASTIVEIVIEMTTRIENMVMPCSRNKVRILSAKDVFLSRTFPRVGLILATCA